MKSIDDYFQEKPSPYYLNSIDQFFSRNRIRTNRLRLNVVETDQYLKIEAPLPGVAKKDIHVNLYENEVGIRVKGFKQGHSNRDEIEETVQIPFKIREQEIKATYENGLLRITLPKERKMGKQITIRDDSKDHNRNQ